MVSRFLSEAEAIGLRQGPAQRGPAARAGVDTRPAHGVPAGVFLAFRRCRGRRLRAAALLAPSLPPLSGGQTDEILRECPSKP